MNNNINIQCDNALPHIHNVTNEKNKIDADSFRTIDSLIQSKGFSVIDSNGNSLLHYATQISSLSLLNYLLDHHSFPINTQNFDGDTALTIATALGDLQAVQSLIQRGAAVHLANTRSECPLHIAAAMGHLDIGRALVEEGGCCVDVLDDCGDTPLHYAVREERGELVELLLGMGANPDLKNNDEESPMELAELVGSPSMKKILSEHVQKKALSHQMGTLSLQPLILLQQQQQQKLFMGYYNPNPSDPSVWKNSNGDSSSFPKRLTPNANLPGGCLGRLVDV